MSIDEFMGDLIMDIGSFADNNLVSDVNLPDRGKVLKHYRQDLESVWNGSESTRQ
jgi:hypothetical protein